MGLLFLLDRLGVVDSGAYVPDLMFGGVGGVPVRTSGHTGTMKWSLIPAAVLGVMGVIFAPSRPRRCSFPWSSPSPPS
jgi:hypothetical protein